MRNELTDVKSKARRVQAQLIRGTDQYLAERLALATKESQEREVKMKREIEQLLNDHANTPMLIRRLTWTKDQKQKLTL